MDTTIGNQPKKVQPKVMKNDSIVEQFRGLGGGVTKTIKDDIIGGVANDALSSLFGTPSPRSGDLQPGQPLTLNQPQQQPEARPQMPFPFPERFPFPRMPRKEPYKPAISQETMNLLRKQEAEVQKKIEEIRIEVKSLIAEMKQVDQEIQKTVASEFVDPGVYHISFLDRLKETLKLMLKEMKQSKNWLQAGNSRKKRKGYWGKAKKQGTSFTQNFDRNVSTQVG